MDATEALAVWVAEGQIDSDLAERLRTSLAAHDEPQRTNKIIWVLVSIGAVLTGAGLLLFIASQWDQSSPLRRLALLFTIYLLVVGAAALADRQQLGVTAKGLWFLSSIAVGVNIFLVGQIYNLPLNYWQGTLLVADRHHGHGVGITFVCPRLARRSARIVDVGVDIHANLSVLRTRRVSVRARRPAPTRAACGARIGGHGNGG